MQASHESAFGQRRAGMAGGPVKLAMICIDLAIARANRSMPPWALSHAYAHRDCVVR